LGCAHGVEDEAGTLCVLVDLRLDRIHNLLGKLLGTSA
jgi:hypothetical protein